MTWPRLLHEAKIEHRTLVFVDESGFYLLPSVVKTYAPMDQTPVLRAKTDAGSSVGDGRHDAGGPRYTLTRQESLDGSHSVEFLVHLMRVASERLLVIWDGSPIHRRALVKDFVMDTHGKVRLESDARLCPGFESVGRRRLESSEECGDGESGLPGRGAIAPGVSSGDRAA